jgi:hypothetical protein
MNFVTGQPSRAEANTKAAELATLPASALTCMTSQERNQVVNFTAAAATAEIPTAGEIGLLALVTLLAASAMILLRRMALV